MIDQRLSHLEQTATGRDGEPKRQIVALAASLDAQGAALTSFPIALTVRLDKLEQAQKDATAAAAKTQASATTAQTIANRAATAAAAASQTAGGGPTTNDNVVHTKIVIAGFLYDQPCELIENVSILYLERTRLGRQLLSSSGSPACVSEAPYVLGSVARFETNSETTARRLVAKLRAMWSDQDIEVGGVRYTLRSSVMRIKQERERNARLLAMGKAAQTMLHETQNDNTKKPYTMIFWTSASLVVGPRRIVALVKNSDDLNFHQNWYGTGVWTQNQAKVEEALRASMKL